MIFLYDDYRDYLHHLLLQRKKRNSSYSLRAFARALDVPISTLSEVLRKNKNLPFDAVKKVTTGLRFRRDEARYFNLLVEKEVLKSPARRREIEQELVSLAEQAQRRKLEDKHSEFLNHCLKFALIELGGIEKFSLNVTSATKALQISEVEALSLLESLVAAGALTKPDARGRYCKVGTGIVLSSETMNLNLRQFHMDMMERAKRSLVEQSPQERLVGSETFSFDSAQMSEANDLIEDFFAKMVSLANRSLDKDSVYHLGVQMFRLTQVGGVSCD